MQSAVRAVAWEFWSANRRGWLLVLAALVACGVPYRIFARSVGESEGMQFLAFMPLVAAIILAMSFCNFTDRNRRDGIAGFPRHLFSLPVRTAVSVTCVMVCSLLSVVGIYVAWVTLVLQPIQTGILVRWPATILAAFVVLYQAIIWCLCGFRLTRVVGLSLVATLLVAIGFLPALLPTNSYWASEGSLTAALAAVVATAYVATVITVDAQRRGGARGLTIVQDIADRVVGAIPRRQLKLRSPEAALFAMEWRRAGFVLPTAVLVATALILGPVIWFTGRDEKDTLWAEMWLCMMPILLAFPIGMGFGKPDFWSLDLSLSPFVSTRPVTGSQILAAKLKAAAVSAVLAWAIVFVVGATCIYMYCDTKHWWYLSRSLAMLYSPLSQWLLPIIALTCAVLTTWSLLVSSIWMGYSGRPGFYYTLTSIGLAAFTVFFFMLVWWQEHPRSRGDSLVGMLPWLPWALAGAVTLKTWLATLCARELLLRRLVSNRGVAIYFGVWLATTSCLLLLAWLLAPRIEWFRGMAILVALGAMPAVTIAVAPLTIAWNRHR